MKIVIDARFWGPSHTGLGVYTRELVNNLAKIDGKNQYTLLIRKDAKELISLPENFSLVISEASAYSFKEQFLLPWQIYKLQPDLVHFPSINVPVFYFGSFVVTIHDLIKHTSRGTETSTHNPIFYWFKYLAYRVIFLTVLRRASAILVPSKSIHDDITKRYESIKGKVHVTYESAVLEAKNKVAISLPKLFGIYTGNIYPHKNVPRLISAWKEVFEKTGLVLIISSGRSIFTQRIMQLIARQHASKYIQYVGYLSDDQLYTAYTQAKLFVFPSLIEGFGLPGLDAMRADLPVVCSNIPVLKEIYGNAAYYFDPYDEEDMASKLIEVTSNNKLRDNLIEKGKKQVEKYSWKKTAQETLAIYDRFKK